MKWLQIDKDNLHIKFSASNIDFSDLSPDPLGSRKSAHASVKKGYFSYFIDISLSSVKTVADRQRHAAYQAL